MAGTTAPSLADAGKLIIDAEIQALQDIKSAAEEFQAKIAAISDRLTYPTGLNLRAKSMANEFSNQVNHKINMEIPSLLTQLGSTAPMAAPAP